MLCASSVTGRKDNGSRIQGSVELGAGGLGFRNSHHSYMISVSWRLGVRVLNSPLVHLHSKAEAIRVPVDVGEALENEL